MYIKYGPYIKNVRILGILCTEVILMKLYKRYITVEALINREGKVTPLALYWENGERFEIDKILNTPRQSCSKVGGCGLLYECQIHGQTRQLYYEQGSRWFIESYRP